MQVARINTPVPKYKVFVVTKMDGRVDPAHILDIDPGHALVVRNTGGRVTDPSALVQIDVDKLTSSSLLPERSDGRLIEVGQARGMLKMIGVTDD